MQALPMIIAMAITTYATRLAGFAVSTQHVPKHLDVFLKYVPIAAFAALVATGLQDDPGAIEGRALGAVAAGIVILWSKRLWLALIAGMVSYWIAGWLA